MNFLVAKQIFQRFTAHAVLTLVFAIPSHSALAWDSVGHRITAAVALHFTSEETRDGLLSILAAHPRYREDFLQQMPAFIESGDATARAQWLLGQAAYWPDVARGLTDGDRRRYNRPQWHYTDGSWVRGSAPLSGNLYVGISAFPEQQGELSSNVVNEDDAHNVVTALDYNTQVLSDASRPMAERAIALCWVLHLIGDIHQPLHTGSLYSAHTLVDGDRGGNRIPVQLPGGPSGRDLNLHSLWDLALREFGVSDSLPPILQQVSGFSTPRISGMTSDWTAWMGESRQILRTQVYTETMKSVVREADDRQLEELDQPIVIDSDYLNRMQRLARQRLGLAGLRLAVWFENELP